MGGGEGSAAREALRHRSVEKVVMCDIDQVYIKYRVLYACHVLDNIVCKIHVQTIYIIEVKNTRHDMKI